MPSQTPPPTTSQRGSRLPPPSPQRPTDRLMLPIYGQLAPEDAASEHWLEGGFFVPESCAAAFAHARACANNPELSFEDCTPDLDDEIGVDVIWAYQPLCNPARGMEAVNYNQKAKRLLAATADKSVEYMYWTGVAVDDGNTGPDPAGVRQTLAAPAVVAGPNQPAGPIDITGGVVQSAFFGLQSLIQAAATQGTGGPVMIHAAPKVVFLWGAMGLTEKRGGTNFTKTGDHIVVGGSGYPGTGPGNTDPGDPNLSWAYATNIVQWFTTEATIHPDGDDETGPKSSLTQKRQSMIRQENRFERWAEQPFILWRDPCVHAAVQIKTDSVAGL